MQGESEQLELLRIFLSEGADSLDAVEPMLIEMQRGASGGAVEPETINAVFRAFHSMKGSASSLRLRRIASVAHHAESLLDLVRKGAAPLSSQYTGVLLRAVDLLRSFLQEVEQKHSDGEQGAQEKALVAEFEEALGQAKDSTAGGPKTPPAQQPQTLDVKRAAAARSAPVISAEVRERFVQEADELLQHGEQCLLRLHRKPPESGDLITAALRSMHSLKGNCGFIGLAELEALSHKAETVLLTFKEGRPAEPGQINALLKAVDVLRSGVAAVSRNAAPAAAECAAAQTALEDCLRAPSAPKAEVEGLRPRSQAQIAAGEARPLSATQILRNDIRVDVAKLDALGNLLAELVMAEAMVTRHPTLVRAEDEGLERAVHQLRRVLSDLQDVALGMRMVPLSATFRKMLRLVHDLSSKMAKQVKLELKGEETEVDKSVLELLSDPLVHILRNALDHGLETPQERVAAGKPEVGTVTIEAKHEGGEVLIRISDDGRGLDRAKILAKATERGLVREANGLRDREIFNLIFEPGFSTADKVTDVSGRGVGMDVVKKNIEKLKGRIELRSKLGLGTTVMLRIPLTLAIIDGMLLRVGSARYTLPMLCIRESFRPRPEQMTVTPDAQELVRVREELIPVLRLHKLFGTTPDSEHLHDGILVVVETGGQVVALFADEILGQQQTVIKGLSGYLSRAGEAHSVSGCTILGDGEVSLVLDVGALVTSEAAGA